jgi:hypothetical protein
MASGRLGLWLNLARGLPDFLQNPVIPSQAPQKIRHRLELRDKLFLSLINAAVYKNPSSPYHSLLLQAGCKADDLRQSVHSLGLESTLEKLSDEGVRLSLEEFKGQEPIRRSGLYLGTKESDFDNPLISGSGISGKSSATRSTGTQTNYTWPFIAEEAENECVLYGEHGLLDASLALWYPVHTSIAGIHNILMNLKYHRAPEKWFSHTAERSLKDRLMLAYLGWCAQRQGMRPPNPETATISDSLRVATWMEETRKRNGSAVLRTYTSSAVRAVQAAAKHGRDLSGSAIFVGGEPLSSEHHTFMTSAGIDVIPRYVTTEAGLVGASCTNRKNPDEMHIYRDRLAVIQGPGQRDLLITSILPTTPKLLLNVDLGDEGFLTHRECGCTFGKLGMTTFVSNVRSKLKQTGEGMSVFISDLEKIVGSLINRFGGSPADYQFRKAQGLDGLERIAVIVSPTVEGIREATFIEHVFNSLRALNLRCRLASDVWRQTSMFVLVRDYPMVTKGQKQLLFVSDPFRPES